MGTARRTSLGGRASTFRSLPRGYVATLFASRDQTRGMLSATELAPSWLEQTTVHRGTRCPRSEGWRSCCPTQQHRGPDHSSSWQLENSTQWWHAWSTLVVVRSIDTNTARISHCRKCMCGGAGGGGYRYRLRSVRARKMSPARLVVAVRGSLTLAGYHGGRASIPSTERARTKPCGREDARDARDDTHATYQCHCKRRAVRSNFRPVG